MQEIIRIQVSFKQCILCSPAGKYVAWLKVKNSVFPHLHCAMNHTRILVALLLCLLLFIDQVPAQLGLAWPQLAQGGEELTYQIVASICVPVIAGHLDVACLIITTKQVGLDMNCGPEGVEGVLDDLEECR